MTLASAPYEKGDKEMPNKQFFGRADHQPPAKGGGFPERGQGGRGDLRVDWRSGAKLLSLAPGVRRTEGRSGAAPERAGGGERPIETCPG